MSWSRQSLPEQKTTRVLVTGFGSFPGTRRNPTEALVHALCKYQSRLARLGIALELVTLPVIYAEIAPRLAALANTVRPDVVLHLGLASRRKKLSIETRAVNRSSPLHPDARRALPAGSRIAPGCAHILRSTFPGHAIVAALGRRGIDSRLSIDAGSYVCNHTLYLSLMLLPARSIGFMHVPRLADPRRRARAQAGSRSPRPTFEESLEAVSIAILVMARHASPHGSGGEHGKTRDFGPVAAPLDRKLSLA